MVSKAQLLVDLLSEKYGDDPITLTRAQVKQVASDNGINSLYRVLNKNNQTDTGDYHFPPIAGPNDGAPKPKKLKVVKSANSPAKSEQLIEGVKDNEGNVVEMNFNNTGFSENLTPTKDKLYVSWGNHSNVKKVVASGLFYPVYITGLSGNGKTKMVEQVCAELKRECIRVNFTVETDEDDLIGGFRLVNGETKFFKGPVIAAMERGAVLLCDEIDLANPARVMCLQSILEGSGYFIKKTGEYIQPAEGFTIIATANTKGKGSSDGQFIGTNVLNEAFLERYPVTFEQSYPSASIELRMLKKVASNLNLEGAESFMEDIVKWANVVRKTYDAGGVDEVISTRRLVNIVKAFSIYDDKNKSVELCLNRYDEDTKDTFTDLFNKIAAGDSDLGLTLTEDSDDPNQDIPF